MGKRVGKGQTVRVVVIVTATTTIITAATANRRAENPHARPRPHHFLGIGALTAFQLAPQANHFSLERAAAAA
jgi:hypothetical protein